jgi:hypothetical protein
MLVISWNKCSKVFFTDTASELCGQRYIVHSSIGTILPQSHTASFLYYLPERCGNVELACDWDAPDFRIQNFLS